MKPNSMAEMAEIIAPLAEILETIDLADSAQALKAVQTAVPFGSDLISDIRMAATAGAKAGWLLPKENSGIRFGRIAKSLSGFTVDAVLMNSPGPKHRHGNGEVDLCFATQGEPTFDGHPEGWVIYPPGSVHTPTVKNGEMLILYFLPKGAIEFL